MKVKMFVALFAVVAIGLSLSGCCFRQAMKRDVARPAAPPQVPHMPKEKKQVAVQKPATASVAASEPAVAAALNDIHFGYDKFDIRPVDAEVLKKNYEWFNANPGRVSIEGHCDERGSVEYNLALGQKRADSAKSYMIGLGLDGKRVETVSYGKEKPVDPGHNETAWLKNRRVHFTPLQ